MISNKDIEVAKEACNWELNHIKKHPNLYPDGVATVSLNAAFVLELIELLNKKDNND